MILSVVFNAHALSTNFSSHKNNIFSEYSVLDFKLTAPFSTLLKFKKENEQNIFAVKEKEITGQLQYTDNNNKIVSIPVKIHLKGFTTLSFCTFPKLEIKISKSQSKNTLFEGINSIDLNTHCIEEDDKSDKGYMTAFKSSIHNHRESMIYRIMSILNMPSFQSRPVMIEYEDTAMSSENSVKSGYKYQAFFLEDYGDFRKRNNLKAIRGVNDFNKFLEDPNDVEKINSYKFTFVQDSPKVDTDDLARAALLQFFIGNHDWFVQVTKEGFRFANQSNSENLWNMKIVEDSSGKWITIPQDFNLSLFATANEHPMISKINTVVFDSANKESKIHILKSFIEKKDEIYKAISELDENSAQYILLRLDKVYSEIQLMLNEALKN